MADDKERQAVDKDLDVDEERSEEIAGGAAVPTEQAAQAAAQRQPINLPRASEL